MMSRKWEDIVPAIQMKFYTSDQKVNKLFKHEEVLRMYCQIKYMTKCI